MQDGYFGTTEVLDIGRMYRAEKWDKSKEGPSANVENLLNYKDKECILKNTQHTEYANINVHEDFSKETMAILKSLWTRLKITTARKACFH